jgi:hypothetical protein
MHLYRMRAHGGLSQWRVRKEYGCSTSVHIRKKYCRRQRVESSGTRTASSKPARDAGLCPLCCVVETVLPSHIQWRQVRAKSITKMRVNYIQKVNVVSQCWTKHHAMKVYEEWPASSPGRTDLGTHWVCPSKYGRVLQNTIRSVWQHEL